jgi:hypothetical protein
VVSGQWSVVSGISGSGWSDLTYSTVLTSPFERSKGRPNAIQNSAPWSIDTTAPELFNLPQLHCGEYSI